MKNILRFQEGDCWALRSGGAFQRHKGVPTHSGRTQAFLLALEGLFRRLPEDVERSPADLSSAIQRMWRNDDGNEEQFIEQCVKAAVCNLGDSLIRKQRADDDSEVPGEIILRHWRVHTARVVQQLKSRLARELTMKSCSTT